MLSMGWFDGFTGGRVSDIIRQESKRGKHTDHIPISKELDKINIFNEKYIGYVNVDNSYESFLKNWDDQKILLGENIQDSKVKPLFSALWKTFKADFLKAMIAKTIWGVSIICSINYFVFYILDYIKLKNNGNETEEDTRNVLFYCAGFFGLMFILSVAIQQMGMYSSLLGCKVKAALTTSVYKKMIIREGFGSKADAVSLVAKDIEKIAEACTSVQYLWSGIAEAAGVFAVVIKLMGIKPIAPGLGLMCLFLPAQYMLGLMVAYKRKRLAAVSNGRINLMEEILRAVKLIKIYGWEASFFKKVHAIRAEEGKMGNSINQIKSLILGLTFCLPPLMSMVIFGTQEALGKIDSVLSFTVLSFFNTLRVPFSKLPKSLRDTLDAISCMERIQSFLLEAELDVADLGANLEGQYSGNKEGIVINKASFAYGKDADIILSNINMSIEPGSLVMVAGPVAGGKSNFLKALLGELTVREGSCTVSRSKAYVPQTPWTNLGTVKDNILFGLPMDEAHYKKVLHACALERDLEIMDDGDMTWIGERGGNLSGGQKQRIALARAAYSRAELYVLDSPLSAVDMYTCQHIFKYCIQDLMIAGGGTVVLATHQTELFSMSSHLCVMKDCKMVYNDKYSFQNVNHLFPSMVEEGNGQTKAPEKKVNKTDSKKEKSNELIPKEQTKPYAPPVAEYKEGIYTWYMRRITFFLFSVATFIFIVGQICRVYSDSWISIWNKRSFAPEMTTDAFYAGMYALTVIGFLFIAFLRAFFYYFAGKIGANTIHNMTFAAALKAPMHFFHVTPIGKLLSFFSKDVEIIDDQLVDNALMLQIFGWILILALSVVCYNLPIFAGIAAALLAIYAYVVRLFIAASERMMKEAGQNMSQVVAHTSETLSGLPVVRAFRMQDRFVRDNIQYQTHSTVSTFAVANLSLWLAFRVDIIGCLLVICCCLLAVLGDINPSDAGLIVSNSFQILLFFSIMSRTMGETHDNMGSADRARIMADLEEEIEPEIEAKIPDHWPAMGQIMFEGVVMPYLPGKAPVLKGITFTIREGEKIGVVGRTGAGKSSLIVALYRLAEISEGRIFVDGVDCSSVSLNTLRSSMAIIPQEPVMFQGTIRTNLDPFSTHTDEDLINALHKCLLGPMLESNKEGLDTMVAKLGSNFSLGTQQLMCLARAFLNPSRILLLDEATAALDSDTNNAVQHVLKANFMDRTIFTIAHRLDTIIDSDRILTMDAGVIAEFESPATLLDNPNSIFYELCMNTGKAQFDALRSKARANAELVF
jgi:ABC-type multidrug transport system fused ATPase/permease subunit